VADDSYELDPQFERTVVWLCSTDPRFYSVIGHAVEVECLGIPIARRIMQAVHQIAKEAGRGPPSTGIVIQRLARLRKEGTVDFQELEQADEMYGEVEDRGKPDADLVKNELLPIIRRRIQSQAIVQAHNEFSRRGDFVVVQEMLAAQASLGESAQVVGVKLGRSGFDRIKEARTVDRLSTGVVELDLRISGGMPRRSLAVWVADTGKGKSTALVHQTCECLRRRMFVGFVTLELPESIQLARIYGNLTGVETEDILLVDRWREEAERRYLMIEDDIGLCEIVEMPSHTTSVGDLARWIDQKEQEHGIRMEALVIDYADMLTAPRSSDKGDYVMMREVYSELVNGIAKGRGMWVSTASQATRPKGERDRQKKIDVHHIADSMHKARICDGMFTLNPRDDGMLDIWVAKLRLSKSGFMVGPLVMDFDRSRLVPVTRELGQW
jgi:KaiC/GvpD/RAD55 family RecA-like ATPase